MAVSPAMFLFEVVVESINSLVESRRFIIKSDFADIFSLELKDPKQMHITMPEPPPLPPEPAGKKGKKAKKRKANKGKKRKKGKKGKVEEPPPEPVIQSGQSVLFSSTAEFLIQTMKKFPMEISLWSQEDNFVHIGSASIPWPLNFLIYLQKICNCEEPCPVKLNEEYNVFQEGTAKLMAKIGIQIKLTYLSDKITTTFRTLSEDPTVTKFLYTGINSKTTSYICTMKTTEEVFEQNCNKIENNYYKEKPKSDKIVYADYKNAPSTNLTFFKDGDYCCMMKADKPPLSIYKSPETSPDIDFIIEYVRKIIISCNDNMRMLTPRPVIAPRVKAADIDKLCYCRENNWPEGQTAENFKNEVQSEPCPVCINARHKQEGDQNNTFDMANIRGPCGRPDCKIAKHMRAYIENLIEEDKKEININEIVGPCGSRDCTIAEKIKEILRHEGAFTEGSTLEGLSTQCACIKTLHEALTKRESCHSSCSRDCQESNSKTSVCDGKDCPSTREPIKNNVYSVYYFTVEHDFDQNSTGTDSPTNTDNTSKYKYYSSECSSIKATSKSLCSQSACSIFTDKSHEKSKESSKCQEPVSQNNFEISPVDSNLIIHFENIQNPCNIKSCDVAEKVKDIIADGITNKKNKNLEDHCYCDCVCDINFSCRTTYCGICGGYECLGDDIKELPEFRQPHPCPIYHKLYDKKNIKVESPWPDETELKKPESQANSNKSSRTVSKGGTAKIVEQTEKKITINDNNTRNSESEKKAETKREQEMSKKERPPVAKKKTITREKKQIGKFTANVERPTTQVLAVTKTKKKSPYPLVPKNMGWNWTLESIPGIKPRPKWRPGALKTALLRKYRAVTEGVDVIAKKKRAMMQKKKKLEMKPTLVVSKQKGEYKVQMEVFKAYSKERLLFQYPYDEKPPLIYTIGKTEEEKRKIQKQQERRERRETRRKSRLIQSTFRDRCQEICLKAYNQAIGLLPLPNPNDPECPCETAALQNVSPSLDSCSCSDEGPISSSDTDDDEWVIEFTPPVARWNTKVKHPPAYTESDSQYNYLDYKVKLLDKSNNPVVRFFKGPDGKQECSDLGGFWGPGHVWLEINKDGYIGPDNRWVPNSFFGPDGNLYSAEEGVFTDSSGRSLKIGVDGYLDKDRKWVWYSKVRSEKSVKSKSGFNISVSQKKDTKINDNKYVKEKENLKSALATKTIKQSENKKQNIKEASPKTKVQKSVSYSSSKGRPLIMYASFDNQRYKSQQINPRKTGANLKTMNKYKEIMEELALCDDICAYKPLTTINRASNTPRKRFF